MTAIAPATIKYIPTIQASSFGFTIIRMPTKILMIPTINAHIWNLLSDLFGLFRPNFALPQWPDPAALKMYPCFLSFRW